MLLVKALRKAKHLRNSIPHAQDFAPCYGSYVASESAKKSEALFRAQDLAPCIAPILRVKALKLIPAL